MQPQQPHHQPPPQRQNTTQTRILWGLAVLVLVVLVLIAGVLIGKMGGSETPAKEAAQTTVAPGNTGSTATTSGAGAATVTADNKKHMARARWADGASGTMAKLRIKGSVDLSPAFAPLATPEDGQFDDFKLYQAQDKGIIALYSFEVTAGRVGVVRKGWAYDRFSSELKRTEAKSGDQSSDKPQITDFDLAQPTETGGYFNIQGDGIPETAKGVHPNQIGVVAVKPDAFDKTVVWVVIRGAAKLYKTELTFY